MSKTMTHTIRGHNPGVTRVITLLGMLVLVMVALVFALRSAPTTSAGGAGGSSITQDPYIERHNEVVVRHHGFILY